MYNLGDGHGFTWVRTHDDDLIGLTETHPTPHGPCSTTVLWAEHTGVPPAHVLVDEDPDPEHISVRGVIECRLCGAKGEITDGEWVSA